MHPPRQRPFHAMRILRTDDLHILEKQQEMMIQISHSLANAITSLQAIPPTEFFLAAGYPEDFVFHLSEEIGRASVRLEDAFDQNQANRDAISNHVYWNDPPVEPSRPSRVPRRKRP
jgi:hypothetical protein